MIEKGYIVDRTCYAISNLPVEIAWAMILGLVTK